MILSCLNYAYNPHNQNIYNKDLPFLCFSTPYAALETSRGACAELDIDSESLLLFLAVDANPSSLASGPFLIGMKLLLLFKTELGCLVQVRISSVTVPRRHNRSIIPQRTLQSLKNRH